MSLQSIAHYVVPASICDIGSGINHLAKKDATEEQCQKLVAGAIRVSIFALTVLAAIAAIVILPAPIVEFTAHVVCIPIYFLDKETGILLWGTIGPVNCVLGIVQLAKGLFAKGASDLLAGTSLTVASLLATMVTKIETEAAKFATEVPKDTSFRFPGVFADKIDGLGVDWGSKLYEKTL